MPPHFDVFLNLTKNELLEMKKMLESYPTPSLNKVAKKYNTNSATITSLIIKYGWFTPEEYEDRWGKKSIRAAKVYRHTKQDMAHWVDLFQELKSLKQVREALLDEGRLAPKTSTIRDQLEQILGTRNYKKLIEEGLCKYKLADLQKIARNIGLKKTNYPGIFLGLYDPRKGCIPNLELL